MKCRILVEDSFKIAHNEGIRKSEEMIHVELICTSVFLPLTPKGVAFQLLCWVFLLWPDAPVFRLPSSVFRLPPLIPQMIPVDQHVPKQWSIVVIDESVQWIEGEGNHPSFALRYIENSAMANNGLLISNHTR